jgi:hypothetical protein
MLFPWLFFTALSKHSASWALSQKAVTKKRVLVKISELAEAKHLR